MHVLNGHRDSVYAIQSGRNASEVYSAGGDGMIVQWNLKQPETGELIAKLPNSIYALHYIHKQGKLIAAQNFEGIHLIDIGQRKELVSLKLPRSYIFDMATHNQQIFVACGNGMVLVIDSTTWQILKRLDFSKSSARTIAMCEEKGEFAVGYSDNFIRIFDLDTGTMKQEWLAHDNSVFTLRYNQNSQYLLSGSRDAKLKVWNADGRYALEQEIVAHMYTINHIAFSPDGKHFVTCSTDKSIKVWDSQEYKLLKVIDKARHAGHGTSVNKLAWTTFNNQLVSASDDKTLSVWDIIF
ncbi:MAG TPA: WD40 repeat domain-containing protein [Cyclobacteriaceae bacterium]